LSDQADYTVEEILKILNETEAKWVDHEDFLHLKNPVDFKNPSCQTAPNSCLHRVANTTAQQTVE
jgi:hypothetical protein